MTSHEGDPMGRNPRIFGSIRNFTGNLAGNAWDDLYSFVQPKLKKLTKPAVFITLGGAAILGIQNRDDVKSAVNSEIPTVKASLIDSPKFLEPQVKPIDENTEERLPAAIEARILICNDITDSGRECSEDTVYFTEDDVLKSKVEVDKGTITIQKRLLESNQIRPWVRVSKER